MLRVLITGSSGFVGSNLIPFLSNEYIIEKFDRQNFKKIESDVIIHLAGKAHDLKNSFPQDEYFKSNTYLTNKLFDEFLKSNSKVFIYVSSVKAVSDSVTGVLNEDQVPNPKSFYGISKLLAEKYILSKKNSNKKRIFILRPCMIHGPRNKGNLNLLYRLVSARLPWFLGLFNNKRSYCSIDNMLFVIKELIENKSINSGIYNIADDEPLSINEVVSLIGISQNRKVSILKTPKFIIKFLAVIGDWLHLPFNSVRLKKLTEPYVVSNKKILNSIKKELPTSSKNGMIKTFKSFKNT
tara:strand:+ start:1872 stop:2759 length:888 start_codon:yes stop_codon:yes gene_type:complete